MAPRRRTGRGRGFDTNGRAGFDRERRAGSDRDRESGLPLPDSVLKSYRRGLNQVGFGSVVAVADAETLGRHAFGIHTALILLDHE